MRYVNIPGTELKPSVVSLGTNRFGTLIERADAFELLDAFIERGGSLIDTAHIYANWVSGSEPSASEKTIGEWLAKRNCRERVVLATKAGHPHLRTPHLSRLSASELLTDVSESIEILQTDYVDLLWLHRDAPAMHVGEIVEAMNQVIRSGKARYVGCSNWQVARIKAANAYARTHRLCGFVANQPQWSLAVPNREALSDPENLVVFGAQDYDFHRQTGMALIPYSTQAQGFFEKLSRLGIDGMTERDRRGYYSEENLSLLPKVRAIAKKRNTSINAVALSYLLWQPFATIAVVGPSTVQQLLDSVVAADVNLSRDEVDQLRSGNFANH